MGTWSQKDNRDGIHCRFQGVLIGRLQHTLVCSGFYILVQVAAMQRIDEYMIIKGDVFLLVGVSELQALQTSNTYKISHA